VPGGFLRGLFEYIYTANGLQLYPHIPSGITALRQKFPVYYGEKKIYISVNGSGSISAVMINDKPLKDFTKESVFLSLDALPGNVYVSIGLGGSPAEKMSLKAIVDDKTDPVTLNDDDYRNIDPLRDAADTASALAPGTVFYIKKISLLYTALMKDKLQETYEAQHAVLTLKMVKAMNARRELNRQKKLRVLPERARIAADNLYVSTVEKLTKGLVHHLEECKASSDKEKRRMYFIWSGI
jgi:hypothetical protein